MVSRFSTEWTGDTTIVGKGIVIEAVGMIEGEETTKEAAIITTMTEAIKEEGTRTMNTTKKDSVETITMMESVVETIMRRESVAETITKLEDVVEAEAKVLLT